MRCALKTAVVALLSLCLGALPASPVAAEVIPWTPPGIASPLFESHPAFDPRTGDFYFVRSGKDFRGWRILRSTCSPSGWTLPEPPAFAGDGVEADPWFTPDGRTLYFISTRSTDGVHRKDLDLWRVTRGEDGRWAAPQRLPEPVNSSANEWFPRMGQDGWLYFGSARAGGAGKNDIWRAREGADGRWTVENLGPPVNGPDDEYEAERSPDGQRMIVMRADGLYLSRRQDAGWGRPEKLGPEVNVNRSEVGALFSPSGRSMLFARDTGEPASGEFFLWREGAAEDWPPHCPR